MNVREKEEFDCAYYNPERPYTTNEKDRVEEGYQAQRK